MSTVYELIDEELTFSKVEVLRRIQTLLVLARTDAVPEEKLGICHNISGLDDTWETKYYNLVNFIGLHWEKYSGDLSYPIPHRSSEHWAGEELELRVEFLEYMIERVLPLSDEFTIPKLMQLTESEYENSSLKDQLSIHKH